jgi:hypothetical protein
VSQLYIVLGNLFNYYLIFSSTTIFSFQNFARIAWFLVRNQEFFFCHTLTQFIRCVFCTEDCIWFYRCGNDQRRCKDSHRATRRKKSIANARTVADKFSFGHFLCHIPLRRECKDGKKTLTKVFGFFSISSGFRVHTVYLGGAVKFFLSNFKNGGV